LPPAGTRVLAAAEPGQSALAVEGLRHGLFTYHLLRGIAGGADEDRDGRITADELFAYVKDRVVADAAYSGDGQSPRSVGAAPVAFEPKKWK
jgi:uncharacterized caspase-like protein